MNILYVPKEDLYPAFGFYGKNTIKIRKDLPKCVQKFLLVHELYHSTDKEKNWVLREVKANFAGFFDQPVGFFVTLIMSLTPYRLKFYWNRIKEGR